MRTRRLFVVIACLLLPLAATAAAESDGPDILIRDGTIVATAADYEMDGTMWVTFTLQEDSCTYLYRSTDHGLSWEYRASLRCGTGIVKKLGLVVGEGDSGFVHLFYLDPANDGDLMELRVAPWNDSMHIFPVYTGPDTIRDFAACRDYTGGNYWLYVVTTNPDSPMNVRALSYLRSHTYGREWVPIASASVCYRDPHLAAGPGSYIYFAARFDDVVHVMVNDLYFDPLHWRGESFATGDSVTDPVIAPAFTLPESSATVWCAWAQDFENTGDWDVKFTYTTDAGQSWANPGFLSGQVDADEQYPDLRNYTSPGNQYINASYVSDDNVYRSVYRRYAHATTPDQWSDTLRINEGSAGTGSDIRPKLCYTPGGPFSGAGCVFVGAGLSGCWWNAPYPVAVAEPGKSGAATARLLVQPSVGRGPFHIRATSPASISIHDHAGRLVRSWAVSREPSAVSLVTWDGRDARGRSLADGIYFVRLAAGDCRATEKLVLQR